MKEPRTVTRKDMAELLQDEGLMANDAKQFVSLFFGEIRASLNQGENVKLSGFGKFMLRTRRERVGRDFRSGKPLQVEARETVVFRPSQTLKYRVAKFSPPPKES